MPPDSLSRGAEGLSFSGISTYLDRYPEIQETQPRIHVKFRPEGARLPQFALLDTGSHYCILNRELVSLVSSRLTESIGQFKVRTAYGLLQGDLYTHRITLLADAGESLDFESTLFIAPDWAGPNFLGYVGALDRVRFAVDPRVNRFYFGQLL